MHIRQNIALTFGLIVLLFALVLTPPLPTQASSTPVDSALPPAVQKNTLHWLGTAGNQHWSNPANWQEGRVPGAGDIAQFGAGTPDAVLDNAFGSVVGGIELAPGYAGSVTITHPLMVQGAVRVSGGLLTTPSGLIRALTMDIRASGVVRLGANGKLELAGDGTPLTGDGRLDTTTNGGNSVEYTGHATNDLTSAGPLSALPALNLPKSQDKIHPASPAGFANAGTITLDQSEDKLFAAVMDAASGYAYFATYTAPSMVVKVRLSDFTEVGTLRLDTGEDFVPSAVIDAAGGFAYFGTHTSPGKVVKVRLSDFTRVGALTFNAGEDSLWSAVIDPAGGYAYFGTDTTPGKVVKIQLSNFTRVNAITFNAGENYLDSAVIDSVSGYAYFGTVTSPSMVVKVQLSTFTRVNALTFNSGENLAKSAVIDTTHGFAYFGTATSPGIVVKVQLSNFTRAGAITFSSGEDKLHSAVIDVANGYAYFGTYTVPGKVVKVRLSNFTRIGALPFITTENFLATAGIDPTGGYAYFGAVTSPGIVVKVRLSDFTRVGDLWFNQSQDGLGAAVIDATNGYAYFGTSSTLGESAALPGHVPSGGYFSSLPDMIIKVRLSDFQVVGVLTLYFDETYLGSAVIDTTHGYAYFGTWTSPGIVVKVRLSDFTRVGALVFNPGEEYLASAVIDAADGYAYFGTNTYPGIVVKVRLSDFTRVGALTPIGYSFDGFKSAVIDPAGGYAYFGTDISPGVIIKVRLSDFTIESWVQLAGGQDHLEMAMIDPTAGYAYFGTSNGQVVQVRLSDLYSTGIITFDNTYGVGTVAAALDTTHGYAYISKCTSPAQVVKVRLSDLTVIDTLTLNAGENCPMSAVIDPSGGYTYFGTATSPGKIVKVDIRSAPGPVAVTQVFTTDKNFVAKRAFKRGERIDYFAALTNSGSSCAVTGKWLAKNSAKTLVSWTGPFVVDPGASNWYLARKIPKNAPLGKYRLTVTVTCNGIASSASKQFKVISGAVTNEPDGKESDGVQRAK